MEQNSICIIGAYFGAFPNYFDLWLKSAGKNLKIDFKIFTDTDVEQVPPNVSIIPMTLAKMKQIAEKKLNMKISLEKPYKCCDFKVVYGVIFEDYLKGYEYWGHCDFDLIWGDIYSFLVKNNYQKYDRFLDLGHCSLYRNEESVKRYYTQDGSECGDYKEVFSQDKNFAFDEYPGLDMIYEKHNYPIFRGRTFADISQIYHRYRLALKDKNYDHQVFYWDKGHVYRSYLDGEQIKRDEFMYIHFKKRPNYEVDSYLETANGFFITNHGFFAQDNQKITLEVIERMNPYRGRLFEVFELFRFRCIDLKQRIFNKIRSLRQ